MVDSVTPIPASSSPATPPWQPMPESSIPFMPATSAAREAVNKAKVEKAKAAKAIADIELEDELNGNKVLGDMNDDIHDRLMKIGEDFEKEYMKLHSTFIDMPDEIQNHRLYKTMGDRIASLEALMKTLYHTAASFLPPPPPRPQP